ncbi:enoyl-CoA delta isomerase 1, mitochondrial [Tamandua tetradactyla]|uniref:enoyl-CoA delta isomerase 1, mitochondrial n=1 Tax=Tamandua tetradactyla TaxID=48850 RepID=UPI00405412C1
MALARLGARALLRPGALLRGAALGRTLAAAGGGDGGRRPASQKVLVETDAGAGVAVMRLRSPPVNSLSLELLTELLISLEKLENDKTCRGAIITSDCPGIFSAGLDLGEICGRSPAHYTEYWKALQELWLRLYLSRMALVAAINGHCPAGGCLIALSCDHRILADNPKYCIGLNETLLGIITPFWLQDLLVNTVGHRAAERALQLGLLFPPADALRVGLVDQVAPEDQVQAAALSAVGRWTAIPDAARQLTKGMMRRPMAERLLKQRDADVQNFVDFISRDSTQKALQAYMQALGRRKG